MRRAALVAVVAALVLGACSDGGTEYSGSDILPPVVDSRIIGTVLTACPDGGRDCPDVPLTYPVRALNATTRSFVEGAQPAEDGTFEMTVPAGTYRVEAAPPESERATCLPEDTLVPPGDRAVVEIRCRK